MKIVLKIGEEIILELERDCEADCECCIDALLMMSPQSWSYDEPTKTWSYSDRTMAITE